MSIDSCSDEDHTSMRVKFHLKMHARNRRRTMDAFDDLPSTFDNSRLGSRPLSRWSNSPSPSLYYTVRSKSTSSLSKPSCPSSRKIYHARSRNAVLNVSKVITQNSVNIPLVSSNNFDNIVKQASEKYARFIQPSLSKRCRPLEPSLRPIVLMTNILKQLLLNQTFQGNGGLSDNTRQNTNRSSLGESKLSDVDDDIEMEYDDNSTSSTNCDQQLTISTCNEHFNSNPGCVESMDNSILNTGKKLAKQDKNASTTESKSSTICKESVSASIKQRLRSRRKQKSEK